MDKAPPKYTKNVAKRMVACHSGGFVAARLRELHHSHYRGRDGVQWEAEAAGCVAHGGTIEEASDNLGAML